MTWNSKRRCELWGRHNCHLGFEFRELDDLGVLRCNGFGAPGNVGSEGLQCEGRHIDAGRPELVFLLQQVHLVDELVRETVREGVLLHNILPALDVGVGLHLHHRKAMRDRTLP